MLFSTGLVVLLLILFFVPETSHPGERGIDKANEAFLALNPADGSESEPRRRKGLGLVFLNPFWNFWLLRSPNIMAIVSLLASLSA